MTIKQQTIINYMTGATVIYENNQIIEGDAIEFWNFHRQSLISITKEDESGMIGNPVVISKGTTTEDDAIDNLSIFEIHKVAEHIGYIVDEIESPCLIICSKLSNGLDIVHENHKSMCVSRYPGYVTPSFSKCGSDLKLEEVTRRFIQSIIT